MKKIFYSLCICCCVISATAQSSRYIAAMEENVAPLDSVSSMDSLQILSNNFQRIAEAEKSAWLPYYYAGYCQALIAYMEMDMNKVDGYADQAAIFAAKADSLSPNNSEVLCLKSMVASARIKVDPMTRGMQYGMQSGQDLQKAETLDPANPRVYLLEGEGKFYTPAAYGGGKAAAKPLLQEAVDKYGSFKPKSDIDPRWGEAQATQLLAQCSQ
ncbi:MAG TPA: hypothetical protein VNE41_11350 [Chitinophagaceae bacterium]|nr:hypothetical protein [Chitinophagaceae bacterium]